MNPWEDPDDPMNLPGWEEGLTEPSPDWEDYGPSPIDREQAAAVAKTREEMGEPAPDDDAEWALRELFPRVDWEAAYRTDFTKVDWLPGRFMERGQQVTLVGDGKAGKSLITLEWVWRCAAGKPFLGDNAHHPLRVLYLDKENSLRDLVTRSKALGATPVELENLIYMQFPRFSGALDGEASKAARELGELVTHYKVDVVVIDTISRFIGGKENDSDTWLSLYRSVHEKLKAMGVACLRLDHFGKDDTKGSRGSSAKSQDVDHVWELSRTNEHITTEDGVETVTTGLKLHRTHTRTGLGRGTFPLTRVGSKLVDGGWLDGCTGHELADSKEVAAREQDENSKIILLVEQIRRAGFKGPVSRRTVADFMRSKGIAGMRASLMSKVVEQLKFDLRDAL